MAKTVEELRAEYAAATEETRAAYDAWQGEFGSSEYPKREYEKAVKAKNKKEIARLKPTYDKLSKAYKEAQDKKNALKKELAAAESADKTKKTGAASERTYNTALNELDVAEAGIGNYGGEENYIKAYQVAQQAYDDAVKAGKNPKSLPVAKVTIPPKTEGQTVGADGKVKTPEEATYSQIRDGLADPKNVQQLIDTQKALAKNFKYKGPTDGTWSMEFQSALEQAAVVRGQLPANLKGPSLLEFIAAPTISGLSTGTGTPTDYVTISNPTSAAATITGVISSVLNREATSKEINDITAILNDAQRKNPTKTVNGVTTGGLNAEQFVTDLIKTGTYKNKKIGSEALKTIGTLAKEVAAKKLDKTALTKENILSAIAANGIQVPQEQIDLWTNEATKGKDIETIKQQIRNIAAAGMPDNVKKMLAEGTDLATVYSPYKTQMAAILEINPNDIRLTDPSLTAAIGPNGEMPIYEYQRALRKDPRWQYTNNARDTVAKGLTTVLKDFGFMG